MRDECKAPYRRAVRHHVVRRRRLPRQVRDNARLLQRVVRVGQLSGVLLVAVLFAEGERHTTR